MNSDGIEYVHCNFCGENNTRTIYKAPVREYRKGIYNRDVWDIVRCQHCNLIYANPRIDEAARAALYSFKTPGDQNFVQSWFIDNADLQRAVWQRFIGVIKHACPSGKLLDVGCGAGSFLVEARKMGFDVYGQEVSPFFIDYCRTEQNLTIYDDFLENLDLQPSTFDCITAFDVIEHHPDPMQLIAQMRRLLSPGGVIMISTHDIGNPFARLYGVRWRHIKPIGHITYFTRKTVAQMLEKNGLQVQKVGGIHTIEDDRRKEITNYIWQFFRLIVLRAIVLWGYKPITTHIPLFTKWQIKRNNAILNHEKLLIRAGQQVIMNDDMVLLAKAP